MATRRSRSKRSSRRTSRSSRPTRRRHGDQTDRLLSGQGPYYYEHDTDMKILLDTERPHRQRRLPDNVVYERAENDLSKRGFIRWLQVHPHHQSLGDDHYVLTTKGQEAIRLYRAFMTRIGTPVSKRPSSSA